MMIFNRHYERPDLWLCSLWPSSMDPRDISCLSVDDNMCIPLLVGRQDVT